MKFFLSFLFSSLLFFNLNAQETNPRILFTGGILLDKYVLHESYTQIGSSERLGTNVLTAGTPSTYLSDAIESRGQLSLGLKKINTKGHSIAFNIFAGRNSWARKSILTIDNDDLETEITVPIYIGSVKQNTFGLNATKSFCITKEETRLKAYLGARAEGILTLGEYTADLEGEFATDRQKIEFQAVFVPEIVYFFPGDKFAMSMGLNLPGVGVELNKQEIFNSNLTEEERHISYAVFDFVNLGKSRLEVGFSWLL